MDNPAVFREYAQSELWIAVHRDQFLGFLLVIGGLLAVYYSLATRRDVGVAVARFRARRSGNNRSLRHHPAGRRWHRVEAGG